MFCAPSPSTGRTVATVAAVVAAVAATAVVVVVEAEEIEAVTEEEEEEVDDDNGDAVIKHAFPLGIRRWLCSLVLVLDDDDIPCKNRLVHLP